MRKYWVYWQGYYGNLSSGMEYYIRRYRCVSNAWGLLGIFNTLDEALNAIREHDSKNRDHNSTVE